MTANLGRLLILLGAALAVFTPFFWVGVGLALFGLGIRQGRRSERYERRSRPAREIDLSVRRRPRPPRFPV